MSDHIIETRGLTRTFVKRGWNGRTKTVTTAVDHLDLTVAPGESVGYIGANGAGKSTTIKMLMGILAIAAYAKGPGLGNLIFSGLSRVGSPNAVPQALVGTVLIVILALILDGIYVVIGRLTTSKGLQ